jgi:hypothetical protein
MTLFTRTPLLFSVGCLAYHELANRVPYLLRTSGSILIVEIGGVAQCEAVVSLFESTRCLKHTYLIQDNNVPPQPRCLVFSRI